jgi:regulator of cell morphogenesis and NO signaling
MTHLATTERALDVRPLSSDERGSQTLALFDSLFPGERFVLLSKDACTDLLRRLQTERRGLFDWSPLELGPTVFRTEIARRETPGEGLRGVGEALSWDHDRLDALEEAAFKARAAGDFPAAFDLYAEFAIGLRRHIGFEEQLLFPAFEEASGIPPSSGPTAVMRAEHKEIVDLLERIADRIGDAAESLEALHQSFHAVLGLHNLKEERVLYPGTDRMLGPAESDRLVQKIQNYGGWAGVGPTRPTGV